jgi:hypothetical protein
MEIFNKDVSVLGDLTLNLDNAVGHVLTIDGLGVVNYRTQAEMLIDMGVTPQVLTISGSVITLSGSGGSVNIPSYQVTEGDVTQHELALTVTSSQISDFDELRSYVHDQGVPSLVWSINHNLNKYPSAAAIDTASTVVVGQVEYVDLNNLKITFNSSFSGEAYIN